MELDQTYMNLWEIERCLQDLKQCDDKINLYIQEIMDINKKVVELLEVLCGGD